MRKLILTIIIISISLFVKAQEITLSGIINSTKNEILVNVAVSVYNASTDEIITYNYSDFDGKYKVTFKNVPFYIKAELLGYKNYTSKKITFTESKNFDIIMEENATELDEVVLLQKKRLITLRGDKMIIDIANSGIGDGNNGIETLSKLPGMRLDKDDNILFRGDGNLQILIDGKPSLLSGDALKQYLKTLNGNNINSVEIIANPSAKYDASGTSGILNIRLKKGTVTGSTGNVYTTIGYAEFIKQSNGVNLYNNTKKWNINAGIFYSYNESVNHREVIQTIEGTNEQIELEQLNDWFPVSNSFTTKFGVAYKISENASLGSSIKYNNYKSDEETIGRTNEFYDNDYLRYTLLNINQNSNENTLTGNVYYSFATDSLDTKLDVQINYARYDNSVDKITKNQYLNAEDDLSYTDDINVQNENPTLFNIFSTKIDIEKKLTKKTSLETGAKFSYVDNDYNQIINFENEQGEFVLNELRSNHLIYKESILSFYGILNYNTEKWSLQVGLRGEYIDYDATSKTNNETNLGTDFSFFPSFSINRSFENNQYKLSYSRRIQRPRYLNLNPFFEYVDTYNIQVGNPDLKPQFSNVFDVTWVHKRKTSVSLYVKLTSDEMEYVIDYDENTQITTLFQDNIANSENIGLSINTSLEATKWWDFQFSADFSFNHIKSEIPNYSYDKKGSNWYLSVNQSIKLKNDWNISWNSFYYSGGVYGNTDSKPSYDTSFGVKKHFFNKKLRLNLKANNVLKQSKWHAITIQDNVKTDWTNRWETRKFSLSLTYNFGNGKKKKVKSTDLSDEQNRL